MNTWLKPLNAFSASFILALSLNGGMPPAYAGGGGMTGGSLEITQLLNHVELVSNALSTAETLAYNIRQYEIMYENFKDLPNHVKQQALADLQRLAQIVAEGRAVSYSSAQVNEEYQREHRDFDYYKNRNRGEGGQRDYEFFDQRYKDWAQVNHDSVRGALRAAGLQAQQFYDEEAALRTVENQMESAAGTRQLLQAGGSIASMQVEQMQKLRQLVMAQVQIQAAEVGGSIDRQAEDDSDLQRALMPNEGLNSNRSGGLSINDSLR